jgi:hypothetical protein
MVGKFIQTIIKPANCNKTPLVCRKQALYMFCISWLFGITSIYAIYRGHYVVAIPNTAVFLSSLNYWQNPTVGWRRTLDMITVQIAIMWVCILSTQATYATRFYCMLAFGLSFYPIGVFFYQRGEIYMSTLIHSYAHIFCNLALFILYSGSMSVDTPLIDSVIN